MKENIYLTGGSFSSCSRLERIFLDTSFDVISDSQTIKSATERVSKGATGAVFEVGEFTEIVALIIERMQIIPKNTSQIIYSYLFAILSDLDPRKTVTMEAVTKEVLLDQGEIRNGDPTIMARAVLMPLVV